MSRINLLDKSVYNRIAAGEVVERPFSVVKELVENSIDAGATEIVVSLVDGGKKNITVTDNGTGIYADDLIKALMPHATSKISTASDLDKILTLGFRGEALASISAVSHLTLISKTADEDNGFTVFSDCGETGDVTPYPCETGTIVKVEDLFCNTPARAKFLKPAKTEESDISNVLTRLIFAHPNISFKLLIDGKETVRSFGGSLDEAIIEIYGYDAIKECIKIDAVKNGIKVSGYVGNAYYAKANRTYQTVILNGRYVVNATVQSAVHNAYAPYLMKRKYPFYVLSIEISPEFVDVNVHPNKTDVRFVDNQVVYSTLYSIVSNVLEGNAKAIDIVLPNEYAENNETTRSNQTTDASESKDDKNESEIKFIDYDKPVASRYVGRTPPMAVPSWGEGDTMIMHSGSNANEETKKPSLDDIFAENKRYAEEFEAKKAAETKILQDEFQVELPFRVIGQALTTYLVLERGEDIFFVDQHAAHERLLFDELVKECEENKLDEQSLLVPYLFSVNEKEAEFLTERFSDFRKMGIDLNEYSDGTFAVYALPLTILDMDVKDFFDDVLSDISSLKQINASDVMRNKLAQKACKAAIKSGKTLDKTEIDKLLELMRGDMGLKCPHGRPVAIRITRTEIDKWFKRIV